MQLVKTRHGVANKNAISMDEDVEISNLVHKMGFWNIPNETMYITFRHFYLYFQVKRSLQYSNESNLSSNENHKSITPWNE